MCMIITPLPSPSCRADLFESTSFSHPSCGMTCGDWLALSLMLLLWVHLDIPLFCKLWSTLEMKTECWRIDTFELWCWRRLFKVPWTARRSKQSILKKINLECSLERLILKLKFQYFGPLCEEPTHWERPWCWEGLRAGGEGDDRGWDGWTASPTQWTWVSVNSGSWWWTGRPGVLGFMGSQRVRHNWATELNWWCERQVLIGR